MKKWLIIAGIGLAILLILTASLWLWLTRSEAGARFAIGQAAGLVEQLDYDSLSGGLASGLVIDDLRFAHAGSRVSASRLELKARIELFAGPRVVVSHLRGHGFDVHLPAADATAEPAAEAFDLASLALPIDVLVESLDLGEINLHHGETVTVIERLSLAAAWGQSIELVRLALVSRDYGRLNASGRWNLESNGAGQLKLSAAIDLAENTRQTLQLDVHGPIDALEFELDSAGPARISGSGELHGLPQSPSVDTELSGELSGWPDLPVNITALELALSGHAEDWQARTSARIDGPDLPEGHWMLAASGHTQALTIESLEAQLLDGRISGQGQLDWSESAPASQAELQFEALDLSALYPDWPEQNRIGGELLAATQGGIINIERIELHSDPGELSLTGHASIDPAADRLDVTLEWHEFRWPPVEDSSAALLASQSGRLEVEGRISNWRARVEALLETPELPSARIEASAQGSAEQAHLERLFIDLAASGSMTLAGDVAWAPEPAARLNLGLTDFDPAVLRSELPGRIDGQADIELRQTGFWSAELDLHELEGELRGQPLSGHGQLGWAHDRPEHADLSIRLGSNQLALNDTSGQQWNLQLDAPSLDQLWPDLAGQAELTAQVEVDAGQAQLSAEIARLHYQDYYLETAEIDADLGWLDEPAIELSAALHSLDLHPMERLDEIAVTLDGNCGQHHLTFSLSSPRGDLDAGASGQLPGCLDDLQRWEGQLERLSISETVAGDWRLVEALPVTVGEAAISAGPGCLAEATDSAARLCLDQLELNDGGSARIRLADVPMDLLLLPAAPLLSLSTPLSGQLAANWQSGGLSALDGWFELGSGALRLTGGETDLLTINALRIDLQPGDSAALEMGLNLRVEDSTELTGQLSFADLSTPLDTELDGRLMLDLPDISAFAHLLPEFDRIAGSASGRLDMSGPITGPALDGRISLNNAQLVHAPLGLDIHAIDLALSGSTDQAELSGSARSGEGTMQLAGQAERLAEGWSMAAQINGEQFAFADASWLSLNASPQLELGVRPDGIQIDGDIRIDRLQAGLPPGTGERIEPSPDIAVAGETDGNDNGLAGNAGQPVTGRLGIDLGDNASLAALGLETGLSGGIELHFNGQSRPTGHGTIHLPEGSYRAYGQNLEIDDGEIVFTGQPLDDPRLDIRAVRDIFGDPKVEAAGVHISGSARNPDITLYTDPRTSQEKALAYVITGADFDHAGGQGALNVGFYLLPKLFVSYGVGLFQTGNVLSGRYELSRRWGLRVVSGERDTGVDLSYTVNN